jgi:hypothetical protein
MQSALPIFHLQTVNITFWHMQDKPQSSQVPKAECWRTFLDTVPRKRKKTFVDGWPFWKRGAFVLKTVMSPISKMVWTSLSGR